MSTTKRILTIDDNPAIHEDFRKILCPNLETSELDVLEASIFGEESAPEIDQSFDLDCAHQGQEGLAKVQSALSEGRPYSLAFVDVRMPPGWDGVETVLQLWKVAPDLQVVICTAYSDYSWEEMRRKLGFSDNFLVLKKPFDTIEVLQMAHALTRKWELTRKAEEYMRAEARGSLNGLKDESGNRLSA